MFIKTVKIKKPKVFAGTLMIVLLAVIAAVWLLAPHAKRNNTRELNSETKRQAFLAEMGWEVPDNFENAKTVVIPEEWDEVYERYNELQKQQGFDLSDYKGRRTDIYTYVIKNYPEHENENGIICSLMICDGVLIGGDVCSTALDGFMQGLMRAE